VFELLYLSLSGVKRRAENADTGALPKKVRGPAHTLEEDQNGDLATKAESLAEVKVKSEPGVGKSVKVKKEAKNDATASETKVKGKTEQKKPPRGQRPPREWGPNEMVTLAERYPSE